MSRQKSPKKATRDLQYTAHIEIYLLLHIFLFIESKIRSMTMTAEIRERLNLPDATAIKYLK